MVVTLSCMATNATLLCIHRDPSPLSLLRENGYQVLTATNGHEGLRLFMTRHVDAIVLEYHLGFLDGGVVASEIKKTRPEIPVVMVVDHLEVPEGALKSVDMVVAKFDGERFLLAAIRTVLDVPPKPRPRRPGRIGSLARGETNPAPASKAAGQSAKAPFSPEEWPTILNGTVRFEPDA